MGKDKSESASFNRGLTREFVGQLNEMFDQGGWWRKFVEDPELFLAIRGNYVNVYYRGCSLVRLTSSRHGVVGEVSYKYLLRRPEKGESEYVRVVNGAPSIPNDLFVPHLDQLCDIKAAARNYAGAEKTGVHEVVLKNAGVVDVEIAFGGESNRRVDLAAVSYANKTAILSFFEANISAIRTCVRPATAPPSYLSKSTRTMISSPRVRTASWRATSASCRTCSTSRALPTTPRTQQVHRAPHRSRNGA